MSKKSSIQAAIVRLVLRLSRYEIRSLGMVLNRIKKRKG